MKTVLFKRIFNGTSDRFFFFAEGGTRGGGGVGDEINGNGEFPSNKLSLKL